MKINTGGKLYMIVYLIGGNMDYFTFLVAAFTTFFLIDSVVNSGVNGLVVRATLLLSVVRVDKLLECQQIE